MIRSRTIFAGAALLVGLGLGTPAAWAKNFPPINSSPIQTPNSDRSPRLPSMPFARTSCKDLMNLPLTGGNILKAEVIPAGTYPAPNNGFPL